MNGVSSLLYGIGSPIMVLNLTGNPPYKGTQGNFIRLYIENTIYQLNILFQKSMK